MCISGFGLYISRETAGDCEDTDWALYGLIGTLIIVSARGLYNFIDGTIKSITTTEAAAMDVPLTVEGGGENPNPMIV